MKVSYRVSGVPITFNMTIDNENITVDKFLAKVNENIGEKEKSGCDRPRYMTQLLIDKKLKYAWSNRKKLEEKYVIKDILSKETFLILTENDTYPSEDTMSEIQIMEAFLNLPSETTGKSEPSPDKSDIERIISSGIKQQSESLLRNYAETLAKLLNPLDKEEEEKERLEAILKLVPIVFKYKKFIKEDAQVQQKIHQQDQDEGIKKTAVSLMKLIMYEKLSKRYYTRRIFVPFVVASFAGEETAESTFLELRKILSDRGEETNITTSIYGLYKKKAISILYPDFQEKIGDLDFDFQPLFASRVMTHLQDKKTKVVLGDTWGEVYGPVIATEIGHDMAKLIDELRRMESIPKIILKSLDMFSNILSMTVLLMRNDGIVLKLDNGEIATCFENLISSKNQTDITEIIINMLKSRFLSDKVYDFRNGRFVTRVMSPNLQANSFSFDKIIGLETPIFDTHDDYFQGIQHSDFDIHDVGIICRYMEHMSGKLDKIVKERVKQNLKVMDEQASWKNDEYKEWDYTWNPEEVIGEHRYNALNIIIRKEWRDFMIQLQALGNDIAFGMMVDSVRMMRNRRSNLVTEQVIRIFKRSNRLAQVDNKLIDSVRKISKRKIKNEALSQFWEPHLHKLLEILESGWSEWAEKLKPCIQDYVDGISRDAESTEEQKLQPEICAKGRELNLHSERIIKKFCDKVEKKHGKTVSDMVKRKDGWMPKSNENVNKAYALTQQLRDDKCDVVREINKYADISSVLDRIKNYCGAAKLREESLAKDVEARWVDHLISMCYLKKNKYNFYGDSVAIAVAFIIENVLPNLDMSRLYALSMIHINCKKNNVTIDETRIVLERADHLYHVIETIRMTIRRILNPIHNDSENAE